MKKSDVLFLIIILLIVSFTSYRVIRCVYMEGSSIWYLDKHYGHPDKSERVKISVKGVRFGDYRFYGGAWGKETLSDKFEQAEKLFIKHNLLDQIGLKQSDEIKVLSINIKRSVSGEEEKKVKIIVRSSEMRYDCSGYKYVLTNTRKSLSFWQKLQFVRENINWNLLEKAGIKPDDGISEFKILVKK